MILLALALLQQSGWEFNPKPDTFSAAAMIDLRSMNEAVAGEHGYIQADKNGDFVRGDGQPIRFWAVNTNVGREKPWVARPRWTQTEPSLDNHARFLAKRGVNLIRLHAQIAPSDKQAITDVNMGDIDWIWRSVAAMKKQGIYSVVSPYWMVPTKIPAGWDIPGGAQKADGLLFFDPTLQKAYKGWIKALLSEKNPYTGIPLAKDAALAVFQIQNEDSLLFWTFGNIQGAQGANLLKKYNDFLAKKYGRQVNRIAFEPMWKLAQHADGDQAKILADQNEFLARTMYEFNTEIKRYVREELGCKALINDGNWRTADTVRLNDAERWSYTAGEVDAVNRYTGGIHKGPNEGWSVEPGDKYSSSSALTDPKELPINIKQSVGHPMMVTESMWVMPSANMVEAPFLISAYSSLNGIDAYFWFATSDEQWTLPQSANGYNAGQMKWFFGSPDVLGAFPANAYMYRKGLIQRGAPAVSEVRQLQDVWNRNVPIIAEESGYDPNRDTGDIAPTSNIKAGVDPIAFLLGPVQVQYDMKGESFVSTKGWDSVARTATSNTNQLTMNYGEGTCVLNAPLVQGFAAQGNGRRLFKTTDVTALMQSSYGSMVVVTLDYKPIATSKKILVQFTTKARPSGWKEKPTMITMQDKKEMPGFEITDVGHAPWVLESPRLNVAINNLGLSKATTLDSNMIPVGSVKLERTNKGVRFDFPAGTLYVILE